MKHHSGRHFLQIPGPTNVPERVLRAIDSATVDHRGPEFQEMSKEVLAGLKRVFKTKSPVVIFPASGTGAWEAALVNTLSPGDRVLMVETGHFATLWLNMANKLGLAPEFIKGDWRHGADPAAIEARSRGQEARDQGGVRRAQRDFHRRHLAHRRSAQGHRPREASGALHGGHHLLARLDRLPPRRMGRGRHRRRLAEGPDAAARAVVQRGVRQGARRRRSPRSCRAPTGTGKR